MALIWISTPCMLNLDTSYGRFSGSVEYRFYDGYNTFKQGYIAYSLADRFELLGGVDRKPFGLLPFANWTVPLA